MGELLEELKRRSVFRVAAVYALVSWVVIQVANVVFPRLGLPSWTVTLVIVLVALGFPLALVVAWAFEMSPEGVRRSDADGTGEGERASRLGPSGWGVVALAAVLAAVGAWLQIRGGPGGTAADDGAGAVADTAAAAEMTRTPAERRAGEGRGAVPAGAEAPPRIAVLPFDDIAPDGGDAYFADGMHEEVLSQLSKVSALEVLSRTSVRQYEGTDKTVARISRELGGVDAVLEGSVRRAGERVRITTQLIDAGRDAHLWSESYDRELTTEAIFDIQADIAARIADALERRLTDAERERIRSAPTADLRAYDAYLRGRSEWEQVWRTGDPVHVDRSVEHLREAVRRDSLFAEAHAWLAAAYWARAAISGQERWLDSASADVARALELDPGSGSGHLIRAAVLFGRDSLDAAEQRALRAWELQPSSANVANLLSDLHGRREDWVGSIRWIHRAARLDPRTWAHAAELASGLADIGMLEAAERWARRARAVDPGASAPPQVLVGIQLARGDIRSARATAEAFREERPGHFGALSVSGLVELHAGDYRRAKRYLDRVPEARRQDFPERSSTRPERITLGTRDRMRLGLAELRLGNRERGRELVGEVVEELRANLDGEERGGRPGTLDRVAMAGGLAALGRTGEGLEALERAAEDGFPTVHFLRRHPMMEALRPEPRFREILRTVEANQERLQREVRRLGIDLDPPEDDTDAGGG